MKHKYIAALALGAALLLAVWGCERSITGKSSADDLLSIPVNDSEPRDYKTFNERVLQAQAAGERWPTDPMMVARHFVERGIARREAWDIRGAGEHPSHYTMVVVCDGFLDDSVRGERLDISLEKHADGTWRIKDARFSWRCWEGRGHESFDTEPCH